MPPLPFQPGTVIGREFVIERTLGAGGMGAVFVVLQQSTGVRRALKIMHPQILSDQSLHARFVQEARLGASIPSDHVVQVLTAGVDEATATPFLVMELLEGQELARLIETQGPMPATRLRVFFEQLCHGLGAAHRLGIVHRDLKPENVFLATPRGPGVPFLVKVLDFGIAKIIEEAKTRSTAPMGTPLWMAPEQTATRAIVTPATDVWALGLMAFYCLVGRSYWAAAADSNSTVQALLREILIDELVPASQRARECGVHLEPWFDAWFTRCVHREPQARFADASALWEALRLQLGVDGGVAGDTAVGLAPPAATAGAMDAASASGATERWAPPTQPLVAATMPEAPAPTPVGTPAWPHVAVPAKRALWPWAIPLVIATAAGPALFLALRGKAPSGSDAAAALRAGDLPVTTTAEAPSASAPVVTPEPQRPSARELLGDAAVSFVPIAGGSFVPCPSNICGQLTTLGPYALSKTEISQRQFRAYVEATHTAPKGECWLRHRADGAPGPKADWHFPQQGEDHPVVCITRAEAEGYAAWLGSQLHARIRLPSATEWEFAARAGAQGLTYAWGNTWPPPAGKANIADAAAAVLLYEPGETHPVLELNDGYTYSAPVGKTAPSPFGLYDLTGNVYEWVADECAVRGGSWDNGQGELIKNVGRMKSADCKGRYTAVGFRVLEEPG